MKPVVRETKLVKLLEGSGTKTKLVELKAEVRETKLVEVKAVTKETNQLN